MAQLALAEFLAKTGDKSAAVALFGEAADAFAGMDMAVFAQRARHSLGSIG
jgi:hypothetical protein